MSERDPLDVYKLLNPFVDEAGQVTEADEERLRAILATPVTDRPSSGRRRRRVIAVVGVGAVVLATAAFAWLREERASIPTGIVCYRVADLDGDRVVLESSLDPVAACAQPWTDGTFATDGPPPLIGCVNEAGLAVVFPGEASACARLGLPELIEGRTDEQQLIVDLSEQMIEVFSKDCYRQDDAIAKAQEMLDESGLSGWSVQLAEAFPPGMECGVATPLPELKAVFVVGARAAP